MPFRRFMQSIRSPKGEREPGVVGWLGSPAGQLVLLVLGLGLIFLASTMAIRSIQESPGPARTSIRSVAVLPLANQTGDPERAAFVDGLHDSLIAELAGLPGLSVISRSSVLRYRDSRAPLSRIAADLGVDAVVQGSVQRSLGSVAVVARLVQANPERQIWSGRYEGSLGEALALQRRVAGAIAEEISVAMDPDRSSAATAASVDPAAQEAYFQGRAHWRTRSRESLARAIEHLEESVALAPDFALAHAALADAYTVARGYGATPLSWEEAYARAEAAARRALELNPRLPEAHASLGFLLLQAYGDLEGAEASLREAVRLNPSFAQAQAWLALTLKAAGRPVEAVAAARVARRVDPFSPVMILTLGYALVGAGECAEALDQARAVLELNPVYADAHGLAWRCHALSGRHAEAVAAQERVFGDWGLSEAVRNRYRAAWERGGWDAALREEIAIFRSGDTPVRGEYFIAQRYSLLGDRDAAIEALELARDSRDPLFLFEHRADPLLDAVRDDPRFGALDPAPEP